MSNYFITYKVENQDKESSSHEINISCETQLQAFNQLLLRVNMWSIRLLTITSITARDSKGDLIDVKA